MALAWLTFASVVMVGLGAWTIATQELPVATKIDAVRHIVHHFSGHRVSVNDVRSTVTKESRQRALTRSNAPSQTDVHAASLPPS